MNGWKNFKIPSASFVGCCAVSLWAWSMLEKKLKSFHFHEAPLMNEIIWKRLKLMQWWMFVPWTCIAVYVVVLLFQPNKKKTCWIAWRAKAENRKRKIFLDFCFLCLHEISNFKCLWAVLSVQMLWALNQHTTALCGKYKRIK